MILPEQEAMKNLIGRFWGWSKIYSDIYDLKF